MFVRVLGIDPGLSRLGYGVIEGDRSGARLVTAGVLRTSPRESLPERLGRMAEELERLVADSGAESAAVERVLFQANARTAMSVGQASGLALAAAARAGLSVAEYSPNEVKQAVAGYGSATKSQVQAMVKSLLGLPAPPEPPDVADALALALCHLASGALKVRLALTTQGRVSALEDAIQAALSKEATA